MAVVCSGNRASDSIALTFDDGPLLPYTGQLLDAFDEYAARATFFVRGSAVTAETSPLVLRAHDAGHEIGNHTHNHLSLPDAPREKVEAEIAATHGLLVELLASTPRLIRPPYGRGTGVVDELASALGYRATILWSVSPSDWDTPPPAAIVERVLAGENRDVRRACGCAERSPLSGAIVLLHDGCPRTGQGESRAGTVTAVRELVPSLQSLGLRLVTVSELLDEGA
jgi:peptidoglycan/xylan/chitin deacetylase (PgdA/CDA1 family)